MTRTLVIVNRHGRLGAAAGLWQRSERRFRELLGDLDVEFTQAPRDAERIARGAAGYARIIAAGGDGTASQVAAGLIATHSAVPLGVLPMGSGNDFARGLGLPHDLETALVGLANGRVESIDVGRVEYLDRARSKCSTLVLNIASIGVSARVVEQVSLTRGPARFLRGTVRAILTHRPQPVEIRVDGRTVHRGPLTLAAAANGRYFGGGMCVAPDAELDDGALDVVAVSGLSKLGLLLRLGMLYRGSHLADAAVNAWRGRVVEFESLADAVGLEVDGESLGVTPVRIEVLPRALAVIRPQRLQSAAG